MSRIYEPSTWAGIGLFGMSLVQIFPSHAWIGQTISALGAAVSIIMREGRPA